MNDDFNILSTDNTTFFSKLAKSYKLLTRKDEIQLSKIVLTKRKNKRVRQAINKLVTCNLRLVLKFVNEYGGRYRAGEDALETKEIIEYALMGLYEAARTYDYRKSKFSTIAFKRMFWVLYRLCHERSFITLPHDRKEMSRKIYQLRKLRFSDKDISKKLKIGMAKIRQMEFEKDFRTINSLDEINELYGEEVIPDPSNYTAHVIERNSLREYLLTKLNFLTKKERDCIYMYYLDGLNLNEISVIMGVSRQAIDNNLKKGLRRLRRNMDIQRNKIIG